MGVGTRIEHDSMGELELPSLALGVLTADELERILAPQAMLGETAA